MKHDIRNIIAKSIQVKQNLIQDETIIKTIEEIVNEIINCYKNGGKVLFCGNGGSFSDSIHLAAELSGRFYFDRDPLNAEAICNGSYLTAVGNDYSYDVVYSRYIKAVGKKGDILIGISTSGNANNVHNALRMAKELGMITVGLAGESGGKILHACDKIIRIPSKDTPRIQECHILVGHAICELVEEKMFTKK